MEKEMKEALTAAIESFRLPRYEQLPDMGLYLEQTSKYINQCLQPLGCMEITGSMIRNYVKMGLVENPVKKQYYAGHIAHLLAITVLKSILSLEHISQLFERQRLVYSDQTAYDYFCMELENILYHRFGLKETVEDIGMTSSVIKEMMRSAVISVSHVIYIDACFAWLSAREGTET